MVLDGSAIAFVDGAPGTGQTAIGPNLPVTLANLIARLSVSSDPNVGRFSYLSAPTDPQLLLVANHPGVAGNALTLGSTGTVIVPSGPTLVGGAAGLSVHQLGVEQLVAHNLALARQAQKTAARRGVPGVARGPISSEGVNGATVSYDTQAASIDDEGYLNLTVYGQRFVSLRDQVGHVPLQVGIGRAPWLTGPGWAGPPFDWTLLGGPV